MPSIRITVAAAIAAALLTSAGCASAPMKTEPSASGIRAAEEVGAAKVPRAALHLQMAKEGVAKAEALAKDGKKEEGASMLLRAEADAELAIALSNEDAEKTESKAAMERVRALLQANES